MEGGHVVQTKRLAEEVQGVTCGISSKYVVEPEISVIKADLLTGLKRYGHAVRS